MKKKKRSFTFIYHIFVFAFALIMIYPVLWMVSGSFKSSNEILKSAQKLFKIT